MIDDLSKADPGATGPVTILDLIDNMALARPGGAGGQHFMTAIEN
jgi:hypothetical protein